MASADSAVDVRVLVASIDAELEAAGDAHRVEHERPYLESGLRHVGPGDPYDCQGDGASAPRDDP
jgi:hypothetical protein